MKINNESVMSLSLSLQRAALCDTID